MGYTSSQILASVKRNQSISASNFRFTDSDLLAMVDEEIESTIVPTILRLHSDRLIFREVVPLVAGQSNYTVPYRAVGGQIRGVILQDSAAVNPNWKQPLEWYEFKNGNLNTQTGCPSGFYFGELDDLILVPSVSDDIQTNVLVFSYPIQHPRLVDSTAVAIIQSVDYATGIVTLASNTPSTFSTTSYLDFIAANARCKPRLAAIDKLPSSVVTNTITFTISDIPEGLVAGDKVTLSQETDTLLLPNECYKYLCKAVEIKIMDAQKDLAAAKAAEDKLVKSRMAMESILTPRTTGQARVIVNRALLSRNVQRRITLNMVP